MARVKKIKKEKSEIISETLFFLFLVLLFYITLSLLTYSPLDPGPFSSSGGPVKNWGGKVGAWISAYIVMLFGRVSMFFFPLMAASFALSKNFKAGLKRMAYGAVALLFLSAMGGVKGPHWGGVIGYHMFKSISSGMGLYGLFILSIAHTYAFTTLMFGSGPISFPRKTFQFLVWAAETLKDRWIEYRERKTRTHEVQRIRKVTVKVEPVVDTAVAGESTTRGQAESQKKRKYRPGELFDKSRYRGEFVLPDVKLLTKPRKSPHYKDRRYVEEQAQLLLKKLLDFNIEGEIKNISPGPVITMYEFEPAPGIKINRIMSLADDIAMGLSAQAVRITGHIPGKSTIGVEVANPDRETVYIREIIESDAFKNSSHALPLALGKDSVGNPFVTDLARMPHLLVAGATGSGKSVTMHSMIMSLLYRFTPTELRLLLIDPKMLEFNEYNDIPHLLHEVIFNAKEAANALKWTVYEMEKRYNLMKEENVRNLKGFNKIMEKKGREEEKLPYIVIFIDELADLMLMASKQVEEAIIRLSQKARAAGIHLVVATQRPSVDVITGVIKANFTARIALKVASKTDSRVIIDMPGAESLLGYGDMLFLPPGQGKPIRIHGAFVSDEEVEAVCNFLKSQASPEYIEEVISFQEEQGAEIGGAEAGGEGEDPKLQEALEIARREGEISISYLQRKLKIGFNRAARIIETLEEKGLLIKGEGPGKPWKYAGG